MSKGTCYSCGTTKGDMRRIGDVMMCRNPEPCNKRNGWTSFIQYKEERA